MRGGGAGLYLSEQTQQRGPAIADALPVLLHAVHHNAKHPEPHVDLPSLHGQQAE